MADSANILVSPQRLRDASKEFSSMADNFEDKMMELKQVMEGLASSWEGSAAESFLTQFNKTDKNREAYRQAILDYTLKLNESADLYEGVESRIASETDKLDNSQLYA